MFDILLRVGAAGLLTVGAYFLARLLLARFALPLLRRHQPTWAAPVERSRLPMLAALLAAAVVLYVATGLLIEEGYPRITEVVRLLDSVIVVGLVAFAFSTAAGVALSVYEQKPLAKEVPLRGFVQLVQAGIFLISGLTVLMVLVGVPAIYSFAALAALFTAVGFVFQDPIMGFIAGIQLAANKMVAIGDWIDVPQYGANGAVQEILMSTVKVRNWDNTVTTVPARALISDSFKNWRPMFASGGRRLQRAVLLDVHSISHITPALPAAYPRLEPAAAAEPTNLGLYRAYLSAYLSRHPRVNQQMTRLVRQLGMTEDGLPLEITVYLLDTDWTAFETTASSIFEHIFATLPDYGLRPYQRAMNPPQVEKAPAAAGIDAPAGRHTAAAAPAPDAPSAASLSAQLPAAPSPAASSPAASSPAAPSPAAPRRRGKAAVQPQE